MEVQAVDLHYMGCVPECLLYIAILENTVPDFVRASLFMQNALVRQCLLRIHHRIQCLIFHVDQFCSIVCNLRGFRHHRHDRLALVTNFGDAQRIVANFRIRSNFDKRLSLRHYFLTGKCANDSGQRVSRRSVNAHNLRVRVGRTHEVQVSHFAQLDVIGKLAATA